MGDRCPHTASRNDLETIGGRGQGETAISVLENIMNLNLDLDLDWMDSKEWWQDDARIYQLGFVEWHHAS